MPRITQPASVRPINIEYLSKHQYYQYAHFCTNSEGSWCSTHSVYRDSPTTTRPLLQPYEKALRVNLGKLAVWIVVADAYDYPNAEL